MDRQLLWLDHHKFPTDEDKRGTFDHYRQCMYPTGDWQYDYHGFHDFYEDEDEDEDFERSIDWALNSHLYHGYLPGRGEYEYMEVSSCPLCGGDCMERLKREVEVDTSGTKWRFAYNEDWWDDLDDIL